MPGKQSTISILQAALDAVHPSRLIKEYVQFNDGLLKIEDHSIQLSDKQRIFVIGAGKASAAMAGALEKILGNRIFKGLITTKDQHKVPLDFINCLEAGHPMPDQRSIAAVKQTLDLLKEVKEDDIVFCLLSGGASTLWTDIPPMLKQEDVFQTVELLLTCGCDIEENNSVRKHLSGIKGGQLLQYAPAAKWYSLILSDVPGDDLSVIASGPTTGDQSSFADALLVLEKYDLTKQISPEILAYFENGLRGLLPETVKENNPILKINHNIIIGNNQKALMAAEAKAEALNYHVQRFGKPLKGDAGEFATALMRYCKNYSSPLPLCILAGGETTVQVTGKGTGGRNQHLALAALLEMKARSNTDTTSICFLAAGTDGTDGPTDAAGAIADVHIIAMSVQKGLDPLQYYENFDAYSFFKQTDGLLKTGPTLTNVMDIIIVLIE